MAENIELIISAAERKNTLHQKKLFKICLFDTLRYSQYG